MTKRDKARDKEQAKDLWAESALQLESVDSECVGVCGLRALWRLDLCILELESVD